MNEREMADMIVLPSIGPIEDRVIREVHKRLSMGAQQYGIFDENDPRDMDRETGEELIDGIAYQALKLFQRLQRGGA